jgi:cobalt/nickel transport system permease protein
MIRAGAFAMHIPDGFLSAPVAGATWLLAGACVAGTLRAERRDPVPIPSGMLGSLAAFVFAAEMINVPVAPGTSGHLVGATLVAMLIGPWRTMIVMAVVLAVQALLFQDGGFTAYGANFLDMGAAGAFVGFAVASLVIRLRRDLRGTVAGAIFGAFAATLSGAVLTSVWLALSGLYPLKGILPLMLVTHTAIGLLEAGLTGAILVTLVRWRPDLVAGVNGAAGIRRPAAVAVGLLGCALAVAAFLAPFASRLPDGLQRTALDLGFSGKARPILAIPLEKSAFSSAPFSPSVPLAAGLLGTLLVALLAWAAGRSLPRAGDAPHR